MQQEQFERFKQVHRRKFKQISRATGNEHSPEDVESEAWLMAVTMQGQSAQAIDFSEAAAADRLFAYLYQRLVRYTETQVRHAVRLDHWEGDDGPAEHPLLRKLAAAQADDAGASSDGGVNPHGSRAAAYVRLLEHVGNDAGRLAEHLMISLSWCYRCCKLARDTVARQLQLPQTLEEDFMPRRWRSFKIAAPAMPVQLPLNLPLPWEG